MKKGFIILLLLFFGLRIQAQNKSNKYATEQGAAFVIDSTLTITIDSTIKAFYDVISGEEQSKRNWNQFKYLFSADAKLITSGKNQDGKFKVRYLSPEDYIKSSDKWLTSNGFIEKEIKRKVDLFGNMAHVFSSYEAFHSKEDDGPFLRGINSIQLINDGERWWIVNLYWNNETDANQIPDEYLR
jgi:hypothetical protein